MNYAIFLGEHMKKILAGCLCIVLMISLFGCSMVNIRSEKEETVVLNLAVREGIYAEVDTSDMIGL